MSERDDSVYLQHILDAIDKIETYCQDLTEAKFVRDSLTHDAVIRELEIIGEAVKKLSGELREAYPDLPWKEVAGMRDKLIHGYFGVDLGAVWKTVKDDIPAFKSWIQTLLKNLRSEKV